MRSATKAAKMTKMTKPGNPPSLGWRIGGCHVVNAYSERTPNGSVISPELILVTDQEKFLDLEIAFDIPYIN
jgi:hypothetical protein